MYGINWPLTFIVLFFLDNIFIFYSSCQYSTHVGVIYPAHSQKQSNYQTELFLIAHLSALFWQAMMIEKMLIRLLLHFWGRFDVWKLIKLCKYFL